MIQIPKSYFMHRKVIPQTLRSPFAPDGKLSGLQRYFKPRSARTLGFCSSTAKSEWHALQSFVIVSPSELV